MSEATTETPATTPAKRTRKTYPQPESFVFKTADELKSSVAKVAESGGRKYRQYKISLDGKDYFAMESNPSLAAGRVVEYLGHKIESLSGPTRKPLPVRTADDFLQGFATISEQERAKILEALKNQLKGAKK